MSEFVSIRRPGVEGDSRVTRAAFEATWRGKGYEIVDDNSAPAAPRATAPGDNIEADAPAPARTEIEQE